MTQLVIGAILTCLICSPSDARTAVVATPPLQPAPPRISINDNRRPAGRLENGVLTLALEARIGVWHPDGPSGRAYEVAAFAEAGKSLVNPGPLIRVPVGSEVRIMLRNELGERLRMFGFGTAANVTRDSVVIESATTREIRFTATTPGTYYYAGRTDTSERPLFGRRQVDSQLNGIIIVDPPGTVPQPNERAFLISWWIDPDSSGPRVMNAASTLVINGLSWPHTERIDVTQGDSLYWRWVNVTGAPHPMHLHGFYFRVDAKGNGARDTIYAADQRRPAVTEIMQAGQTMAIAWSPARPGNWIFHCHIAAHMSPGGSMGTKPGDIALDHAKHTKASSLHHAMSRLVLGIRVRPRGRQAVEAPEARSIRLLIRSRAAVHGDKPGFAYVLGGSPEEADAAALPPAGPTLVLKKNERVAITIVNRSYEAAAVHWHGIELESFPDGVPGWSGADKHILPAIPAGDSLTVRFTPPRAGTFMYHSHFNEMQQIASGLYGAIVVLEPGERFDPATDQVLLFGDGGPLNSIGVDRPAASPFVNGKPDIEPMVLRAGVAHRFRVINIRSNFFVGLELLDGNRVLEWRHVAKDGADLPKSQAVLRPAYLVVGVGEIYDVEFTPREPGTLTLRFGFPGALRPPAVRPEVLPPGPRMTRVLVQ